MGTHIDQWEPSPGKHGDSEICKGGRKGRGRECRGESKQKPKKHALPRTLTSSHSGTYAQSRFITLNRALTLTRTLSHAHALARKCTRTPSHTVTHISYLNTITSMPRRRTTEPPSKDRPRGLLLFSPFPTPFSEYGSTLARLSLVEETRAREEDFPLSLSSSWLFALSCASDATSVELERVSVDTSSLRNTHSLTGPGVRDADEGSASSCSRCGLRARRARGDLTTPLGVRWDCSRGVRGVSGGSSGINSPPPGDSFMETTAKLVQERVVSMDTSI